jgi:hypothetical protein
VSRIMLKSPSNIQGRSCRQATIRSSCKKIGLTAIINWSPMLLVSITIIEYVRLQEWLRLIEGVHAMMDPPLDPIALLWE